MKIFKYNILTDKELYEKVKHKKKELEDYYNTSSKELYEHYERDFIRCMNRRELLYDDFQRVVKECNSLKKENKLLKSKKKNIIVNMN